MEPGVAFAHFDRALAHDATTDAPSPSTPTTGSKASARTLAHASARRSPYYRARVTSSPASRRPGSPNNVDIVSTVSEWEHSGRNLTAVRVFWMGAISEVVEPSTISQLDSGSVQKG
jgi:hypothetical protein